MLSKERKIQLQSDIDYLRVIDIIDANSDYLGTENPPKIMEAARAKVSEVLTITHELFGLEVYNDIVSEFHLDRYGWGQIEYI